MIIPHNSQGPPLACPPPPHNNGPPVVVKPNGPAPRSMEELCQRLYMDGVDQLLRFQFRLLTQHMKQNEVSDDALRLYLFLYSLTHHATTWILPTPSPLLKEVERETEATKDKVQTTSSESTAHVQPPVVQVLTPEPVDAPQPKPSIPYPSRLNDQKLREKNNSQMLKFLQIFQRLHFDLSFADALLHIPKFASTFKSLLSNKEKLFELVNTPLTENCSAILLKKLPEKLRDPGRFIIPYDFYGLESCMALADLASLAEDVFVQVGKFTFPTDFVVLDYDVDPRVPLTLGRPFLRTACALEFADELPLIDPFPSRKEDNNFDFEADLREIDFLLNQDPSIESNIETIDSILEKFTDEPSLDYLPPPGDEDDDDHDLFDIKSDNDEWKKLLYSNCYMDIDYEKDKTKDSKMKSLVIEAHIVESKDLSPQLLDSDSTLLEESSESSEIAIFVFIPLWK
nr:reverse transcriptase domain-containing protein [Tanacetum cinerariifolium]